MRYSLTAAYLCMLLLSATVLQAQSVRDTRLLQIYSSEEFERFNTTPDAKFLWVDYEMNQSFSLAPGQTITESDLKLLDVRNLRTFRHASIKVTVQDPATGIYIILDSMDDFARKADEIKALFPPVTVTDPSIKQNH